MKKILVVALAVIITGIIACNNLDSPTEKLQEQANTEKVFNELNTYLMQQPHQEFNYPQTRGDWNWVKILTVAKKDAKWARRGVWLGRGIITYFGVATGGMGAVCATAFIGSATGAIASYHAAKAQSSTITQPTECKVTASTAINMYSASVKTETTSYTTELKIPEEYNSISIAGGVHNSVLEEIVKENKEATTTPTITTTNTTDSSPAPIGPGGEGEGGSTTTSDEATIALPLATTSSTIASIPEANTAEYAQAEAILINEEEFAKQMDEELKKISQDNEDELLNSSLEENEKVILEKYEEICKNTQNIKDLVYVSNEYIKTIEELSYLNEETKRNLYLYFSVIVNSANYWSSSEM